MSLFGLIMLLLMPALNSMGQTTVTIGTGTGSISIVPVKASSNYSMSQQIYLASEIDAVNNGKKITSLSFQVASNGTISNSGLWDIYMGSTTLSATASWIPVGSMIQVFSGSVSIPASAGWVTINLASPYTWDGSNLVVRVVERQAGYGSNCWFKGGSGSGAYYTYEDSDPIDIVDPAVGMASGRANTRLVFNVCASGTTATPFITGPLFSGQSTVSGTCAEADGTLVHVYSNGTEFGTCTVVSGSWSFTGLNLLTGEGVAAVAEAPGKCLSKISWQPVMRAEDECAGARELIPSVSYSKTLSNFNLATKSMTECSGSMNGGDVWFRFTATQTKHILAISSGGSGYLRPVIQLFSGDCGSLTSLVCQNAETEWLSEERLIYSSFHVGETYYFRVYSTDALQTFNVGVLEIPGFNASDDCADAIQLGTGTIYHGENFSATRDLNNPQPSDPDVEEWDSPSDFYINSTVDNVVYYKFLANDVGGVIDLRFTNVITARSGMQVSVFKRSTCGTTDNWGSAVVGRNYVDGPETISFTAQANQTYYIVIDGNNGSWSTWDLEITGNAVLPIDLLSFDAHCEGDQVQLNWTTATETNNEYFTLEKSTDAIHYSALGTVPGAGNSNQIRAYTFWDDADFLSLAYYRLKQTDFDGRFTYSQPVVSNCSSEEGIFFLSPNPFQDVISFRLDLGRATNVHCELHSVVGQLVFAGDFVADASTLIQIHPEGSLSGGVYFLHIVADRRTMTQKLLKP